MLESSISLRQRFARSTRRLAALVTVVVCLVPVQATPAVPVADGGERPELRFENETLDLGQLIKGQVGQAEFRIANDGNAPLRILRVDPG